MVTSTGNITPMLLSPPGATKQPSFHLPRRSDSMSRALGQSTSSQAGLDGAPAHGQQLQSQSQPLALAQAQVPAAQRTQQVSRLLQVQGQTGLPNEVQPIPMAAQAAASLPELSNNGQPPATSVPVSGANANTGSPVAQSQQPDLGSGNLLARPRQYSITSPVKEQPQPWPSPPPVRKMSTSVPLQRPLSRASNSASSATATGLVGEGNFDGEPVLRSPQILAQRRTSTTPLLRPQRSQTQGSPAPPPSRPSADASATSVFDPTQRLGPGEIAPSMLDNATIVEEPMSVESIEEPGFISSSPVEMSEPVTPVIAKGEQVAGTKEDY